MISQNQFRNSIALAHSIPGAELRLVLSNMIELVVSRKPNADLDPCALRYVAAITSTDSGIDYSRHIDHVHLTGSLTETAGGIYHTSIELWEERWFATQLSPTIVRDVIESYSGGPNGAQALIHPDECLGVTCVMIGAHTTILNVENLDELSETILAKCTVEELIRITEGNTASKDS